MQKAWPYLFLAILWQTLPSALRAHANSQVTEKRNSLATHKGTSLEWWYLTGPLWKGSDCDKLGFNAKRAPDFGMQFTLFYKGSGNQQGVLLHSAESDLNAQTHRALSFAQALPKGEVEFPLVSLSTDWLDLRVAQHALQQLGLGKIQSWLLRTDNSHTEYNLLLNVDASKIWQHGNKGYLEKLPGKGNFYETIPFIPAAGIRKNSKTNSNEEICGSLWFDHEWDIENVEEVSWNWLALRNTLGEAFMFYEIFSKSTKNVAGEYYSLANNKSLQIKNVTIEPKNEKCLKNGNCYPMQFEIRGKVNDRTLHFLVDATFAEQEFFGSLGKNYWEGLVTVKESAKDWGLGYLEMARDPGSYNKK